MTWEFELYYGGPVDPAREELLCAVVRDGGGKLNYRDHIVHDEGKYTLELTFEFDTLGQAEEVMVELRKYGEHIEGPYYRGEPSQP